MKTQLKIEGLVKLRNGQFVVTGSFKGPRLVRGQHGVAAIPSGDIKVEIIGIGVTDPNLVKPDMDSVLINVQEGDAELLKGATLNFD